LTTRSPAHFQGEINFNNFIGYKGSENELRKGPSGAGASLGLWGPNGGLKGQGGKNA